MVEKGKKSGKSASAKKLNADKSQKKKSTSKYSMGRKYADIKGFKNTLSRFQGKKHKSVISKALRENASIKKNTYLTAYDPATKQFISGTIKDIASGLKVSQGTIHSRLKKGHKSEMKDVKGFIINKHSSPEKLVSFKSKINKVDKIKEPNPHPITEGMEYLEMLKPNYDLSVKEQAENKHFNSVETRFNLEISNNLTMDDIEGIFTESINSATSGMVAGDKVRIIIQDENLQHPISTELMDVGELSSSDIMNVVEETIESNEDFILSEDSEIIITTIHPELPLHKKDYAFIGSYDEAKHKIDTSFKKSIIQIKNKDNLCVPRAIATGYFLATEGVSSKNYDNAKRGRKIQLEKAEELVAEYNDKCSQSFNGEGFEIEDLEIFEEITGCQITAIDGDNSLNIVYPIIEKGSKYKPPSDESKTIYLYIHKGHCDLINNNRVAGFFGKHYFCHMCKKTYEKKDCHKCPYKCKMCCKGDCPTITEDKSKIKYTIHCPECNRYFPNSTCFDNHLLGGEKSTCSRVWKCQDCKKVMARDIFNPETHICGDYLCKNCKQVVRKDHQCYMLPRKLNEPNDKYIYFDYEADISGKSHEVMYAVSMYQHSPEPIIHESLNEWCEWAFDEENHKGYTFIAHNGKGYDFKFIIRWIYEHTQYKPFVIWGGQKIITMSIKELKIRFIDSLSFLTMRLADMPKTFGIKEIKKGYFPHWFNTKKNWDYIGPMPPVEVFKPERMSVKGNKEFMEWYEEKIKDEYIWNQKREMKEYCISDVDILRRCCIQFRKLYLEIANIDPFSYLTIASVCMAIFKYYYIDETYPRRTELLLKTKKMLGGDPSKLQGEVLEVWNKMVARYEQDTLDNVFSEKKIAIFSYKDVEWMRKAFFGGRTNATKLIYNFEGDEEGIYSDITSLYPTVQYYDIYPKGHFKVIKDEDITNEIYKKLINKEYLGFFDIEVEPPKQLYHPVLPTKGAKLVFDLHKKRGIWCSNEVYVALDMGYKITKIYEIRYFEEGTKSLFKKYVEKFLKVKQEASGYPDWVKLSGDMPKGFTKEELSVLDTEDRKDLYIHLYEQGQGILLDKSKINYNPGLRAISKLCLNSLWGKFGQRTNLGRCEIIDNKKEFFKIITNPKYHKINWLDIAEDKIQITYSIKDEYVDNDYNTNMAVACFTTSRARMRLYEEALKPLDRQVLYFDTDSVVYLYDKNNPQHIKLKNGDLLGEWTDELEGKRMVGTFVSGGPKNYSYEVMEMVDGKPKYSYKTKVKGFTLNKETSELLNHKSMVELIGDTLWSGNLEDNKIVVQWHGIKRVSDNKLENTSMDKKYGLCYTKRQILNIDKKGNYDTIPFGWEDEK